MLDPRVSRFLRRGSRAGLLACILMALCACRSSSSRAAAPLPADDPHIADVLSGLRPATEAQGEPVRWTLQERMAFHKVTGVSIAVIDGGRIAWARGFGVKEAGGTDPVTPTTLFQAASMSKPVAALATMRLAQDGKLSLDADVNDYLRAWKVPDNEFTRQEKVTLRRILSHSAGLTVHGFAGFEAGEPLPTLPQILDGVKPAKNAPVRVEAVPGTRFSYSGGGTTVMQLAVSEVTGQPYARFLQTTVLDPLGMTHSTFEQPLPASLAPQAAAGHNADGSVLKGRWHTYPMTAPAGLWTTPSDLARFMISVQEGYAGRSSTVVNQHSIRQMLTLTMAPYGLGFALAGSGPGLRFEHTGGNDGYRGYFAGLAERGQGVVIMMNADNGEPLLFEIFRSVAAAYQWPGEYGKVVATVRLTPEQIARVVGAYRLVKLPRITVYITSEGGRLYVHDSEGPEKTLLLPTSESTFLPQSGNIDIKAVLDGVGPAKTILLQGGAHPAERVTADEPPPPS